MFYESMLCKQNKNLYFNSNFTTNRIFSGFPTFSLQLVINIRTKGFEHIFVRVRVQIRQKYSNTSLFSEYCFVHLFCSKNNFRVEKKENPCIFCFHPKLSTRSRHDVNTILVLFVQSIPLIFRFTAFLRMSVLNAKQTRTYSLSTRLPKPV